MANFIIGVITYLATHAIGAIGFSQIIGCFQNISTMKGKIFIPVILWSAILVGSYFLMQKVVPDFNVWYYAALGISFCQVLFSGKIH